MIWTIGVTGLIAVVSLIGAANGAKIEERGFYTAPPDGNTGAAAHAVLECKGEVGLVLDIADETLHATPAIFGTFPGGGEGGQFDPVPVLSSTAITLKEGDCINAHFSALIGSAQTYGVAPLTLFQVSLTSPFGGPVHMVGHFDTPYGIFSPAIALEAERDVDMVASNFFQRIGYGEHETPPGTYTVDVWWAGAPPFTAGGALGAAFVLKIYLKG